MIIGMCYREVRTICGPRSLHTCACKGCNKACFKHNMVELRAHIRKTCPCNEYPLIPHFYIVKINRGIPIFLIFAPKHRLWVLVRAASAENEKFHFLRLQKSLSRSIAWACFRNVCQVNYECRTHFLIQCSSYEMIPVGLLE